MGMEPSITVQAESSHFVCPKLGLFDALWREEAASGALPRRSAFTARRLAPFLIDATIVERIVTSEGLRYRYRFFGRGLAEKMGDCTGKYMDEVLPLEKLPLWGAAYDQAMAASEPVRFLSPFDLPGQDHLMIETLLAPIADDGDKLFGFLAVAYFFARVPEAKLREQVCAL